MMLRSHEISINEGDEFFPRSEMDVYAGNTEAFRWKKNILDTIDGVFYTAVA